MIQHTLRDSANNLGIKPFFLWGDSVEIEIGKAKCKECGCETKVLVVEERGVLSKCKHCGFIQWEWQPGDSRDYIRYLAEQNGTTAEELLKAMGKVAVHLEERGELK
jgi:hypothetical protein